MKKSLSVLLILISFQAQAAVFTEDFTSTQRKESSTAVWNTARGTVHPTLEIANYQAPSQPVTTSPVNIGDGRDGIFNSSTYSRFGTVVGSVITIDANQFPQLQVTRFHLEPGYTLTSINGPLIIYSLSDVIIDGTIQCQGDNGSPASGASGGAGGLGRCGGKNGGVGGNATQSGSPGQSSSVSAVGGGGATYNGSASGAGGGGGGGYSGVNGQPGSNSTPATNTGGAAGTGSSNHEFTILNGSPGGGGGSGSATSGGGGGGGGGGVVIIHTGGDISVSATGFILAHGGNGGSSTSGGGGGGGSGGSIKIFTTGNYFIDSGTPVDVTEGAGATPSTGTAGPGGSGSFGRYWEAYATVSGGGGPSHASGLISTGTLQYLTTPQVIVSKSFDTSSTQATYNSISANPASPDISFEVAGSHDDFATDDSGWLPAAQITSLNKKRYLRFRMTLTNSNAATPTQVSDVTIDYNSGIKENFDFQSGCGVIKNGTPPGSALRLLLLALLFLPVTLALKLRSNQNRKLRSKLIKAD